MARQGKALQGKKGKERQGKAVYRRAARDKGKAGQDVSRLGKAWLSKARLG
jgi:hypothetical protein